MSSCRLIEWSNDDTHVDHAGIDEDGNSTLLFYKNATRRIYLIRDQGDTNCKVNVDNKTVTVSADYSKTTAKPVDDGTAGNKKFKIENPGDQIKVVLMTNDARTRLLAASNSLYTLPNPPGDEDVRWYYIFLLSDGKAGMFGLGNNW